MASVQLRNVDKAYAAGAAVVRGVSLDVADGELLVLVGPSGSGKSTVLRLIAGLETPNAGQVLIDGHDVTALPPERRDLAMVFQNYALYPHKTVRGNLAFGLQVRGIAAVEVDRRVQAAAAALDIHGLLDRKPAQLSGGQRQRVALGRAIVREPKAFLLDEPLSNLDPRLRVETRAELALLQRRLGATMIYVTHDQEEAMTLGHRVAVMRDGVVEQVGPPLELFRHPVNVFVAGFIGSPAMNVWPIGNGTLAGARPHDVELTGEQEGDGAGRVEVVEPLGATTLVHVRVDGRPELLRVVVPSDARVALDERVGWRVRADRVHRFDAATGLSVPR